MDFIEKNRQRPTLYFFSPLGIFISTNIVLKPIMNPYYHLHVETENVFFFLMRKINLIRQLIIKLEKLLILQWKFINKVSILTCNYQSCN